MPLSKGNVAGTQPLSKVSIATMLIPIKPHPPSILEDQPGKIDIFRINEFRQELYVKELYGQFYSGDCYIILYTYIRRNTEKKLIYMWQGRESDTVSRFFIFS